MESLTADFGADFTYNLSTSDTLVAMTGRYSVSYSASDNGEEFYAPLPCGVEEREHRVWIRGVCYSPSGDFFAIDGSNSTVVKYSRNNVGKYKISDKSKLPHRPRDITYVKILWNGVTFSGLAITLETNKMAYLTESLETWRLIKTDGEYSGVCCLPNTNLLVVVNSMTSSVDVITAYGLCLYSYRMPNHVCKSHGYLAVTLFNDNPVIIVSAQTGIICMNMNWSGKRGIRKPELSLRSIQRYVHPEKDRFKPEGLCAIGSHVLVADFSGSRVVKFKLMAGAAGTNRLFLYKIGEHDVLEPLALDIVPLEDGAAQIGVARLKGRAPGYHLLKFINITLGDNERRGQRGISLYSPSSSSA